jgi:hypothetical protein
MTKNLPLFDRETFAAKVAASFATLAILFTLSAPAAVELLYGYVIRDFFGHSQVIERMWREDEFRH